MALNPDLFTALYKPDVLMCLADLSNDEVFTPPDIANQVLDMLPQELFRDPNTKFLDPALKSGVFLREIAKRLIAGLADKIPNLQERCDWIFKNQLYGIAITELTSLLGRRSVYCSKYPNSPFSITKFENIQGNIFYHKIRHRWDHAGANGKCMFCGATYDGDLGDIRREGLETHAYEFIHTVHPEEIFNMKFDVIISNPPYQIATGGGSEKAVAAKQAKPLFHLFVEQAKKLNPRYVTMIIPARWYSGGIGLNDFRSTMLHDKHVTKLVDYVNSKDCFSGVDIAGGICYFLWERDRQATCEVKNIVGDDVNTIHRDLDELGEIFIRSNPSISIIHKVKAKANHYLDEQVYPIDAFGFPSKARGEKTPFAGAVKLVHSQGVGYVKRDNITRNSDIVDKYKATISILVPCNGEVGIDPKKGYKSITTPRILKPGEITTFSYLVLGAYDTEEEIVNFKKYMLTKFARFMLRLTFSSMHIARSNFMLVPQLDFTREWTDQDLAEHFDLDESEVALIESTMREMHYDGSEEEDD